VQRIGPANVLRVIRVAGTALLLKSPRKPWNAASNRIEGMVAWCPVRKKYSDARRHSAQTDGHETETETNIIKINRIHIKRINIIE